MDHGSGTATRLDRANFRVVKANARGEDRGFYLLGFIPILWPSLSDAMDQLQAGIDSEGRAISLANVTQEHRNLYLVLFSLPKVIVRADVVEFVEDSTARAPAPSRSVAPAARTSQGASPASLAPRTTVVPRR